MTSETVQLTLATSSPASGSDLTRVARERRKDRQMGTGTESGDPVVWALCGEKPQALRSPECLLYRVGQRSVAIAQSFKRRQGFWCTAGSKRWV